MKDYIDTTKSVSSLSEPQERKVRAYKKLSQTAKKELVELIIRQNFSIRRAAKQLSINYSSAKIILSKYRLKQRMLFIPEIKSGLVAQFKQVAFRSNFSSQITLVSLVSGRSQYQSLDAKKLTQTSFY